MKDGHNIIKPKLVLASATLLVITLSIVAPHFAPYTSQAAAITPNSNNNDKVKNKNIVIGLVAKVSVVRDDGNLLGGAINEGDEITGRYVYNIKTPDSNTDNTVGDYFHNEKPYGIAVKAGNLVFQTDANNVNFLIEIVNRDTDNYLLRSYNNLPVSEGVLVEHISWQLDDNSARALSSDSLKKAPTPPVLSAWNPPDQSFGLTITGNSESNEDNEYFIRAHVVSVELLNN